MYDNYRTDFILFAPNVDVILHAPQYKLHTDFFRRDFVIIKEIKVRDAELTLLGSGTIVRKALRFDEYLRITNNDDNDDNNIRFKNMWFLLSKLSVFIEVVLNSAHKEFTFTTFNLFFKPTGHVMYQEFNIQQLYALPTLYLCVLYLSGNKQRLVSFTA
jgi:hypothetical protein